MPRGVSRLHPLVVSPRARASEDGGFTINLNMSAYAEEFCFSLLIHPPRFQFWYRLPGHECPRWWRRCSTARNRLDSRRRFDVSRQRPTYIDDTSAEWKKTLHRTMVGKYVFGVIMIPSFSRGGSVCTYVKLDGPREDSALRQVPHCLVPDFAPCAFRRNRDNASCED